MGIETLIAKINEKVEAQIAENRERALAAADEETSKIAAAAQAECDKIALEVQSKADAYLMREELKAELDAKNATLEMKNRVIDAAFEKVSRELIGMELEEKVSFFSKLAKEAKMNGKVKIIASVDMAKAAEGVKRECGFDELEAVGGNGIFLLCCEDYDIDLSVGKLLSDVREEYSGEISKILFHED